MTAGVSERAPDTDSADAVQLVGVVETLRLERARLDRAIAVAMGLDAVDDILDARRFHTGRSQVAGGENGRSHVMRVASSVLDRDVVEQRGRAHDLDVGRLGLGNMDAQPGDAQYVVEVVGRIAPLVKAANLILVNQTGASFIFDAILECSRRRIHRSLPAAGMPTKESSVSSMRRRNESWLNVWA